MGELRKLARNFSFYLIPRGILVENQEVHEESVKFSQESWRVLTYTRVVCVCVSLRGFFLEGLNGLNMCIFH